jgi:hypothetical protein
MEKEGSLLYSQQSATDPYSVPNQSSPYLLILFLSHLS